MPVMTGKTPFMEMLRAEGVKYVFGIPGTSELAIMYTPGREVFASCEWRN